MSKISSSAARIRISSLLDDRSFVEIGAAITARSTDFNLNEQKAPGDGVITGYGVINGSLVYVYSQDSSVLNGTVGEMHAKKIINLYDMALKMGAPVIGLIDCGGIRLQEGNDALYSLGELYKKQAEASGLIPQIVGIFGGCGGGLAILSAMSDFTFMEEKKGRLFVNSPNAIIGNKEGRCNTASGEYQSKETGLIDVVGEESYIIEEMRRLISMLPSNNKEFAIADMTNDDLNRSSIGAVNYIGATDRLIADIADDNSFCEIKRSYSKEIAAGFVKINGTTVGAVANRTEYYDE
ncbi:MAG: carboxyl transferase domain-containing protein, partial [Clostridiaceae bacterium]